MRNRLWTVWAVWTVWTVWAVTVFLICGCSGGQSSPPSAVTVSGVAATGAAVSGTVSLKDAAGHELSVSTADGTFSFDVTTLTPPFMLKASWSGNTMYSFSPSSGTANITPLTHLIVAAAASRTDLAAIYLSPNQALFSQIATDLPTATASIRESLKPLLVSHGADINPISGKLVVDGTGMDGLLDRISVNFSSGTVSVTDRTTGSVLFSALPTPTLTAGVSALEWSNDAAAVAHDPDLKSSDSDCLAVWWKYGGSGNSSSVIQARWLASETSPTQISTSTGFAAMPKVAVDAAGNAIVVWLQSDDAITNIWVNRYAVGSGWGTPKRLTNAPSTATGPSGVPSIAIDAAGNAVIMWNQSDAAISSHFDVYTSRYLAATGGWSAPAILSSGTNSAYGQKVVATGSGKAAVIYAQYRRSDGIGGNGDASDMWVATGSTTGGFTTFAKVSSSSNSMYGQASLAISPAGDLLAAWIQNNDSGYFDVWVSRQPAGGAWESASPIANSVTGECYSPEVAFDGAGNAFATWEQQSDAEERQYVAAARYTVGGAWSTKAEISEKIGNTFDQQIAVDASGNATVVWYQIESAGVTVRSARYLPSSGWGASQLVSQMPSSYDGYMLYPAPRVDANASGKTFIVWGSSSN